MGVKVRVINVTTRAVARYEAVIARLDETVRLRESRTEEDVYAAVALALDYLRADRVRVGEAATMLGVTENTVKNWARQGRFPSASRTEGGHWRFSVAEVLALRDASRIARSRNDAGLRVPQQVTLGDPFEDVPVF